MTLFYLLTVIICSAYSLFMISCGYAWIRTADRNKPAPVNFLPATYASILVPVRNEEDNILNCLSSIYSQTYPVKNFEVIVVDDHSTDKTRELIELQKYQNLRLITLSENQMGKKQAIAEGVKAARGGLILTTDADCVTGTKWLSEIISFYEEKKPKMIVAPVLLSREKRDRSKELEVGSKEKKYLRFKFLLTLHSLLRTFLHIMQSQEMTVLTASACAALYRNRALLCSGANLAYEKSAFIAVNGFEGVDKTATGDDIFLMLKIHKKFPKQIHYLKSKNAIVFTRPQTSAAAALGQRKRWASKNFSYGFSYITWIALLVFGTNFLILFSGIMSAINLRFAFVPAMCLSAKFVVDFMLLYSASSFFGRKVHPFVFVFASLLYPVYVSFLGLISPFTHYSWKGRKS